MEESIRQIKYKLVLIGGSAGSLNVLLQFFPFLKSDLKVAIIIVLHRNQTNDAILIDILSAKTILPVKEAEEKEQILPGCIYVAPSNYHLLIEQDHTFSLDDSEKVNFSRPSIDTRFESAAEIYGSALCAILLSGANADGTKGLKIIKEGKGLVAIQQPESAEIPFMPANAMANMTVDYILQPSLTADFINNLPS